MNFEPFVNNSQLFLLIFMRIFAMVQIAPLLSSSAIPQIAKIGLSGFTAIVIFPMVQKAGYTIPENGLAFGALILGEIAIGIIIGFFLIIFYTSFLVAGQIFSMQMGFAASQVFDPLAQIQIPIMGQFLNLIAMFVFISISGFQKLFLIGVYRSFQSLRAYDFVSQKYHIFKFLFGSLTKLFEQALIISFPILGTLLLVTVTMGLLAKAAPQMNLLMLGFPVKIGVAFLLLFLALPFIMEKFVDVINMSFDEIQVFVTRNGVSG